MVAKIISGKSIRGILHYNENKVNQGEAYLLLASGFAGETDKMDFSQKLNRFKHLTDLNAKVKTNALHISLNFHLDDQPGDEKLQQISLDYMEQIGIGDQPFLVYRHLDSAHPHIHIVTTNIQRDGTRLDLHDIGKKRSEPARKALEIKYGLIRAEGQQSQIREKLERLTYGERPTKSAIANIVTRVLQEYAYSSFADYKTLLEHFGVLADRGNPESEMFKKNGLQYFALDVAGKPKGVPIKASSIYRKPTMASLEKRYEKNAVKKKASRQEFKKILDSVLVKPRACSMESFSKTLNKQQISTIFRKSEAGNLYGITYIDHRQKIIFNGSELGKAYSAKAITERLEQNAVFSQGKKQLQKQYTPLQSISGTPENTALNPGHILDILTKADHEANLTLPRRKKKCRKGKKQVQEITL
ncbi:conjugal transfer protein MobB [Pedobacter jeongneungensis]|uniref:Conjugal transfer protein MobB n=1 Tax=Pedobacter jeongneungensis TaxID=947309 RepID=A0ABP8BC29_9SPHI